MNLIIDRDSLKIIATTDTEMEAQIVMDSLLNCHEYEAYAPMGRATQHPADTNKDTILQTLRDIGQTQKIYAIKTYRAIYGVGLTEAMAVIGGAHPSH